MKKDFKYQLDKTTKKFYCPKCAKKTFVRYKDVTTSEYLPEKYGRCDRSNNCQHSESPYLDRYASTGVMDGSLFIHRKSDIPMVYFDKKTFEKTTSSSRYKNNVFLQNLSMNVPYPFDQKDIVEVAELYKLGTIIRGIKRGAIAFPFIDVNNKIRAVQVKQFDANNNTKGKPDFLHSMLMCHYTKNFIPVPPWLLSYYKNEKKLTCLFGEHLLKMFPENPIVLVEAPKTAIYGTLYYGAPKTKDDKLWLAVGSKDTFTLDRLKVLKGRIVIVFPDLSKDGSTFRQWQEKANAFTSKIVGVQFQVSDFLEKRASPKEREDGLDIADFLIRQNWNRLRS